MRTSVVEAVTSKIREKLINDFLKESKLQGDLTFSNGMKKLFFRAKELNYRYVPETKWDYQRKDLPVAVNKLVRMIALDLRKSGAIQNKFYDKSMREHIKNPEAKKYLKTLEFIEDEEYVKYRKKIGIRTVRHDTGKKFTSEGGRREKAKARGELANSAYHYVLDSGELFAQTFENTYLSVENQIISKIKNALGRLPEQESKKRKTHIEFFDGKVSRQEKDLRKKIIAKYGNPENITEEQILSFARPIVERERERMEGKMAIQMAINYISGMTDKALVTHAIEIGLIDEDKLKSSSRGTTDEEKGTFMKRFDTKVDDDGEQTK